MDIMRVRSSVRGWLMMWGNIPEHALPRVREALRVLIQSQGGMDWVNAHANCRVMEREVLHGAGFRSDIRDDITEHLEYEGQDLYLREYHARALIES